MRAAVLVATASATALAVVSSGFGHPQTTNPGTYETVKVTLTDVSMTVRPNVAARGVTAVFVITNRGKKTRTWVLGDTTRGAGKTIGFARTVRPDQQKTVVLFLDYRGRLPYVSLGAAKTAALKGSFRIK